MRNYLICAFFLTTFTRYGSGQTSCVDIDQHCAASTTFKQIFEVATGATDGQNRVFHISQIPADQYPLHVFRNGLELTPGADFTLQATYITLTGRAIESPGDLIQAAYTVKVPAARSTSEVTQSLQVRGAINDVLDRFLDRALAQQLATTPPPPAQPIPAPVASVIPSVTQPEQSTSLPIMGSGTQSKFNRSPNPSDGYASLRMLSATLARPTESAVSDRGMKENQRGLATTAQGVEGLGDDLVANPFDIFATSSPTNSKRSSVDPKSGGSRASDIKIKEPMPASLRLLQKALQSK